jgi:hypothetical protein
MNQAQIWCDTANVYFQLPGGHILKLPWTENALGKALKLVRQHCTAPPPKFEQLLGRKPLPPKFELSDKAAAAVDEILRKQGLIS